MKRYAKVIQVKPEKLTEYEQLHTNCWEDACKKFAECNITNFSIHYGGGYFINFGTGRYNDWHVYTFQEVCPHPIIFRK